MQLIRNIAREEAYEVLYEHPCGYELEKQEEDICREIRRSLDASFAHLENALGDYGMYL